MTTNLVLEMDDESLSVPSARPFIHHDVVDQQLEIYVPAEQQQLRACYRSQLPKFLATFMECDSSAKFSVSSIVASDLSDLDDILLEQDIPSVDWIEKPLLVIPEHRANESPRTITSTSSFEDPDITVVGDDPGLLTPETPTPYEYQTNLSPRAGLNRGEVQIYSPEQYPRIIEQVVRSAQRASSRYKRATGATRVNPSSTPIPDEYPHDFDHEATFGNRDLNAFEHDRRIGALGEAYVSASSHALRSTLTTLQVFERLAALHLPDFTEANWQSTIRGELARATRYAAMQNWVGRETADIVYTDRTGDLTRYLRRECTGGFPEQIALDHDHVGVPIEYFLEVKSTVGACNTRFFLSGGQYKRVSGYYHSMCDR